MRRLVILAVFVTGCASEGPGVPTEFDGVHIEWNAGPLTGPFSSMTSQISFTRDDGVTETRGQLSLSEHFATHRWEFDYYSSVDSFSVQDVDPAAAMEYDIGPFFLQRNDTGGTTVYFEESSGALFNLVNVFDYYIYLRLRFYEP